MLWIDRLIKWVGRFVSWFTLVLVLVIIIDVFFRYTLSITSAASFELEWHLFAALFLLGAGWTLQADKHVRVDLFYHKYSEKKKAFVNLFGSVILLLPFCYVGLTESISFVTTSFSIRETSPDPGGLPARYIIKATIPLGFGLLGLQGISEALKSIKVLINA
jgi:TRAP-type mannitol/chloroaromatic compound transport system permease small subunit